MEPKLIKLKTNLNKKLDCDLFVHIQVSQANGIPASLPVIFTTEDNSHPPVKCNVYNSIRYPLKNLPSIFIELSHGMEASEFFDKISLSKAQGITPDTEMVIYSYKKLIEV